MDVEGLTDVLLELSKARHTRIRWVESEMARRRGETRIENLVLFVSGQAAGRKSANGPFWESWMHGSPGICLGQNRNNL